MLDVNIYRQHWQHPLFVQWQTVVEQAAHPHVNYSSGMGVGIFHLRGKVNQPDFLQAVESVLGVALPQKAKQSVYSEQAAVFWLSPDEWMLVCALEHKHVLFHALQDALKGVFAQLVDNSGGFMMMRIHGQEASTVLRHLMPYDVLSLQTTQCVHTVFKRSTVVLSKVADDDYVVVFRRSFADYVWRILQKAAKPYGYTVQKSWQFAHSDWQRYTA